MTDDGYDCVPLGTTFDIPQGDEQRDVVAVPECERRLHTLVDRLHAEYVEMPGLRLTPTQVQRLCGVEKTVCRMVLDALVDEKFLRLNRDGTYGRLADGHHLRPAKANTRVNEPLEEVS